MPSACSVLSKKLPVGYIRRIKPRQCESWPTIPTDFTCPLWRLWTVCYQRSKYEYKNERADILTILKNKLANCISLVVVVIILAVCASLTSRADLQSQWPKGIERTWIGPEYWANPLQDWQLKAGRIECVASGGDRNVFLAHM